MTDRERNVGRSSVYSRWHRPESTARFLGQKDAWELGFIDVDECVYCRYCSAPLALLEIKRAEESNRHAQVTTRLAKRAGLPAFLVVYTAEGDDIDSFEIWQKAHKSSDKSFTLTPTLYAEWLHRFQTDHFSECLKKKAAS